MSILASTRLLLLAGMRLDSGPGCLRRGLLRQAEAPPTAERPQHCCFLSSLLRHTRDPVVGLWRLLGSSQHHWQRRHSRGQPQVRTSWTLLSQSDGLGRKQQGEIAMYNSTFKLYFKCFNNEMLYFCTEYT